MRARTSFKYIRLRKVFAILCVFTITGILISNITLEYGLLKRKFTIFLWRTTLGAEMRRLRAPDGDANCRIPNYKPYDTTILGFIKNYTYTLVCPNEPRLTFVDERGFLHPNLTAFEELNETLSSLSCKYHSVAGVDGAKDTITRGPYEELTATPVNLSTEFVHVNCFDRLGQNVYETCHFFTRPPTMKSPAAGRPNVLLLGLDSMSRLSFQRNLPQSYEYLKVNLDAVVMKGMTKVGVGTEQNMVPFLTGYRMYESDDESTQSLCSSQHYCDEYFDDVPIVWQNFSELGYTTMWIDEWSDKQLFYNRLKGFKKQPTDYFPRPLIRCLERGKQHLDVPCFGSTPTFNVVLDYTKKFMNAMDDNPFFAFSFLSRTSHEDGNKATALDKSLRAFLEQIHNTGALRNTVLLLFGDHGMEVGDIRNTPVGAVEDRMPFMSILLPETLRRRHTHLQAVLAHNSGRLLSWFDMHQLLMDLATDEMHDKNLVSRWIDHVGRSPFSPLPVGRTCREAGVPTEHCSCTKPVYVDVAEDWALAAADRVIAYVNLRLEEATVLCEKLVLDSIESVQVVSYVSRDDVAVLRVAVWTFPGGALFEGTMEMRGVYLGKLLGNVERLNENGDDWQCVKHLNERIRSYCYCKQ